MLYKNETIDVAAVGFFIRSARKMKGYTQKKLAIELDVDEKYISQLERGESCPSYPLIVAIGDILGVSIEFLTRGAEGSDKKIDKETLFYIPEAKGITKAQYNFVEKSIRDMVRNLRQSET